MREEKTGQQNKQTNKLKPNKTHLRKTLGITHSFKELYDGGMNYIEG